MIYITLHQYRLHKSPAHGYRYMLLFIGYFIRSRTTNKCVKPTVKRNVSKPFILTIGAKTHWF